MKLNEVSGCGKSSAWHYGGSRKQSFSSLCIEYYIVLVAVGYDGRSSYFTNSAYWPEVL